MRKLDFDAVQNIRPGRHLYQFYRDPEDYLQLMASFFKAGLAQGHACLWLVAEAPGCALAYEFLKQHVYDLDVYIAKGGMSIRSAEDWYLSGGRFDERRALQNAGAEFERVKALGYAVLRGAGDAAAIPRQDWGLLHQYECKVGPWIKQNTVIGLCCYPIAQCTLALTKCVVEAHDDVLVGSL